MIKSILFLFLCQFTFTSSVTYAQNLLKSKLSKKEIKSGIFAKYLYSPSNDGAIKLFLYKNNRFHYILNTTSHTSFSKGRWSQSGQNIFLRSDVKKNHVPILLKYINTATNIGSRKTKFKIPQNNEGKLMPDARIFINNDSTYCFPFFDTCVGNFYSINRIKVDFDNGFKSEWRTIQQKKYTEILVIAQVDFMFNSYLSFRKRIYRINKLGLNLIQL